MRYLEKSITVNSCKLIQKNHLIVYGEVSEWLKEPVSKTGVPFEGTAGSNPTLSVEPAPLEKWDENTPGAKHQHAGSTRQRRAAKRIPPSPLLLGAHRRQ